MSIEFIGFLHYQESSESLAPSGATVQPDFIREFAKVQEEGDFDKALIAYSSASGDGFLVAQYAAAFTERLGLLVAHRPGFVAPTVAARKFATLDQLSGGRASVNIISGGNDVEQARDGDYLDHDQRYERTGEFIDILRRTWAAREPFSHEGQYYRFEDNVSSIRPMRDSIPVYFSGSSDAAIAVGAHRADTYMLWAESLAGTRDQLTRIRAAARRRAAPIRLASACPSAPSSPRPRRRHGPKRKIFWARPGHCRPRVRPSLAAVRVPALRRMWDRSACSKPPPKGLWWTRGCGPRSRS
jgi:alkanesulfonate monooxygenase